MLFLQSPALAAPPCNAANNKLGANCPQAMNAETARGLGLGTGSRASSASTSALAYNPAALVVGRLYHIEGAVDYMPEFSTVALGGAVVDSSTSKVGAGIGLRGFLSGKEGLGGIDGRLGIAFPFTNAISMGVGARYISLSQDAEDVNMAGETVITSNDLVQGFTMDAALRIQAGQMLHLELASFNFVDLDSEYVPILVNASAAFAIGDMGSVGVDFLTDVTTFEKAAYTVGGGGEFLAGNTVPIRGGYMIDIERKLQFVTAGIGYTDKWVGFDISLRQGVKGTDESRVLGAFRYYVH